MLPKAQRQNLKYHREVYERHVLFEPGSWLKSPDSRVLEILSELKKGRDPVAVLDLGCGVGRNAIPVAQQLGVERASLTCVDFLDTAIEKLQTYAAEYGVGEVLKCCHCDIRNYKIEPGCFNLILAISVLEHSFSAAELPLAIESVINGTRPGGINRLCLVTDLHELDLESGAELEPLIAAWLESGAAAEQLRSSYSTWEVKVLELRSYQEVEPRDGRDVLWTCNYLSMVAQAPGGSTG